MMKGGETEIFMTVPIRTESMKEVSAMKSSWAKVIVVLFVMGLTIFCAKAWAEEWKEFAEATTGAMVYDAASIRSTPEGFVRVWIYDMTQQETTLVEFNCKQRSYHILDVIRYDEAKRIKSRETFYGDPPSKWYDISPKSISEPLYKIVCP